MSENQKLRDVASRAVEILHRAIEHIIVNTSGPWEEIERRCSDVVGDLEQALSLPTQQIQIECTRSHPHELMSPECELRTEIARLTNENARLKAAAPALVPLTDEQLMLFKSVGNMLSAYIDCIKTAGDYESWHYIPEIEGKRDDLYAYVRDVNGIGKDGGEVV